jgi:uncharacterized membrane protein
VIGHPVLALFAGAALWTAAMGFAPLLPAGIDAAVYAGGGVVCHQLPGRTFHLSSGPLAVCARCSGLYLGAVIGFGTIVLLRRRTVRFNHALAVLGVSAVPTAATLVGEWIGLWLVGNASRFVAALPLGAIVAFTIGAAVAADVRQAAARAEMVR